jgi:hypothetical protein
MTDINVEQIMQEIREEIKEKGYKPSDLSFTDIAVKEVHVEETYNAQQLQEALQAAKTFVRVDYYKPIDGKGPKAITKKMIRKMLKPLLFPLCQEQEQYNVNAVQTMNQMYQYMLLQEKKIEELETMLLKEEN